MTQEKNVDAKTESARKRMRRAERLANPSGSLILRDRCFSLSFVSKYLRHFCYIKTPRHWAWGEKIDYCNCTFWEQLWTLSFAEDLILCIFVNAINIRILCSLCLCIWSSFKRCTIGSQGPSSDGHSLLYHTVICVVWLFPLFSNLMHLLHDRLCSSVNFWIWISFLIHVSVLYKVNSFELHPGIGMTGIVIGFI
jgi:hypothetical protein